MSILPELNNRIINRFDKLIAVAYELVEVSSDDYLGLNEYHTDVYEALIVNSSNLVRMVFADSPSGGKEYLQRIDKMAGAYPIKGKARRIAGMLEGLKDDFENGFCDTLEKWISAEINTDYMRQARLLLVQKVSEELDHVLSAVVCGIVMENALRWLCTQQSPKVTTVRRNGQPKRLNALIDDLQKRKVFNALKGNQLRAWAKTRNHAAHGETDDFSRQDVHRMISGVTDFLAEYVYGN